VNIKVIEKFHAAINPIPKNQSDCWIWHGFTDKANLPVIRVIEHGKLKEYSGRRISLFVNKITLDSTAHVLNRCGNKLCVNPLHLCHGDEARL
jgi:hypothetical protein